MAGVAFDIVVFGIGLAGIAAMSWLGVRGLGYVPWRREARSGRRQAAAFTAVGVAVFGAARAERALGWWMYVVGVALMVAAAELPRVVHNRTVPSRSHAPR